MSNEIIIKQFDGPDEFLEWASNAPCLWKGDLGSRETGSSETKWTGTKDYDEAYQLAKYGWPDGLKMLTREVQVAQQIVQPITTRRARYDVAGHFPSPGRAAAGEMFAMVNRGLEFKQKPIVRIRHNFTYKSSISPETVMKWGAALCSYIEMLESKGHQVQLDAFYESAASGGPSISFQFPLKKAGDPLSLASLVFWWAHPSSLRRIELSADERLPIERWYSDGYGRPAEITPVEPGTLALSMADAGSSIEENLKTIYQKHLRVIGADPLRKYETIKASVPPALEA